MASPIRPTLTTLPAELILDIFRHSPSIHTVHALSLTHPRLYTLYRANRTRIHETLISRLYSPVLNLLRPLRHPRALLPQTRAFLKHLTSALLQNELVLNFMEMYDGEPEEALNHIPFYFAASTSYDDDTPDAWYNALGVNVYLGLWDLYQRLFPCDPVGELKARGEWVEARDAAPWSGEPTLEEKRELLSLGLSVGGPTDPVCGTCSAAEHCHWHSVPTIDTLFTYELELRERGDSSARLVGGAKVTWDALLKYLYLYASCCIPIPESFPPLYNASPCPDEFGCEDVCGDVLLAPEGGFHIWDYTLTETLTAAEVKAIDGLAERFDKEDKFPFKLHDEAEQSFTAYWKGLARFTEVDKITGRLVDVETARKKYFSDEWEEERGHDLEEMAVETVNGVEVREVVVDRAEWTRAVLRKREIERLHGEVYHELLLGRMMNMLSGIGINPLDIN